MCACVCAARVWMRPKHWGGELLVSSTQVDHLVEEIMSTWLTDHLFGTMKPQDASSNGAETSSASEQCAAASETSEMEKLQTYEKREVSAEWHVPLRGNLHVIEFEHGTTSGKRIVWVDGKVFMPKYFMEAESRK